MYEFPTRQIEPPRRLPISERRRPRRRVSPGRIVILSAVFSLFIALVSLVMGVVGQPGNVPMSINAVEWLRDNGARGIVNSIENFYYTLEAPSTGGPALHKLPTQPGQAVANINGKGRSTTKAIAPYYEPPNIKPLISPALPGEGVWRSTFSEVGLKHPPVLITTFRSDPLYPQMVAGVAWIDHNVTTTWLYPGIQEPSVALPNRGPEMIPVNMRSHVVAAFNSGFKLVDSGGGVALNGHTYAPMKDGLGTFVRFTNGSVNVIGWHGGQSVGKGIVYARQNLPLIVINRKPNPNLSDGPQWGATLGNAVRVWRSAVGVDKYGNLIYAAADYQTVGSLAEIMIHAGAVRAMQLDINAEWPSFITYKGPFALDPANLLPGMWNAPTRYLTPDDRDFFAVYLKSNDLSTTASTTASGKRTSKRG